MTNEYMSALFADNGLDVEAAAAHDVLDKIAAEEGLDLNSLSIEQVADLLAQVEGEKQAENQNQAPVVEPKAAEKVAAKETIMAETNPGPSVADVALELAKIAAAQGDDVTKYTKEQYAAAFDKVAEAMSDPTYMQKKAEMEAKVAEADALGRVMAHSFHDELQKIAGGLPPWLQGKGDDKGDKGEKSDKDDKGEKDEKGKEAQASTPSDPETEKKAAFERAVEERAIAMAVAAGYDVTTGTKVAGDDQIAAAALELLKSKGYPVQG